MLGAGTVGRTLARSWVLAGHQVILGSRQPDVTRALDAVAQIVEQSAGGLTVMLHEAAARAADVVVVTVPGDQVPSLVGALGDALAGKIVIDATNDTAPDAAALNQLAELESARALASRAFNTVGWEQMANPLFGPTRADLPYAGPDASRAVLDRLIGDVGFRPVYLGADPSAVEAGRCLGPALVPARVHPGVRASPGVEVAHRSRRSSAYVTVRSSRSVAG